MALNKTQISQLYVSLFGRASEGEGNLYWQITGIASDMGATADRMLETEAAKTYFGWTLNNNQTFIEHIYLNTFEKSYTQDPEGVDYWVTQLEEGKTKGDVVASLVGAAQHPDNSGPAQDQFANRTEVSDYTADKISEFTDMTTFAGFINAVTDDDATVSAAKASVDQQADANTNTYTITLTKGKDTILGDAGDDEILGMDDTYNINDTISGGGGTDTLTLLLFSAEIDRVKVDSVENIMVRNASELTNIDAGSWNGVDLLTLTNSAAKTVVSSVQGSLTLSLDGNSQNVLMAYADDVLGTDNGTQMFLVKNSTADLNIQTGGADKITSLDITAEGTSMISLAENDLKSITISGDGNLALLSSAESSDNLVQVSSVVASFATGDLTLDMSAIDLTLTSDYFVTIFSGFGNDVITASKNDNRVNGGSGDDLVIISSGLDKMDLLEGGDGTDTLSLTSADFIATAMDTEVLSKITGFETIGISDELDSGTAMDISPYGVNFIIIEAGIAGDEELTGFTSNATIEIQTDASETDILTITMPGATNAGSNLDILNIVFNADLEAGDDIYDTAFDVKGINQILVSTSDSTTLGETTAAETLPDATDGYNLLLSNDGNVNTINVTGDHAFSFATSLTSTVENIVAKNMNGNMNLDFKTAFGGTQGVDITSGNGTDTITGSVYGDNINAGSGNDIIHLTPGTDRITGGTGADTFMVAEAAVSIDTVHTLILDFSAVSDTTEADKLTNVANTITSDVAGIDVSSAEASGGASMVIIADVANGIISLSGADSGQMNTFDEWLAIFYLVCEGSKTAGFEVGENTYIAEESSTGDSVDSLVELTGVVSITQLASSPGENTVILSA